MFVNCLLFLTSVENDWKKKDMVDKETEKLLKL